MEIVYVPAGEFVMGSDVNDPFADADEIPSHRVFVDAFWMDKIEVTNAMYELCIDEGACTPPAQTDHYSEEAYANHPIIGVSWDQANAYCGWAGRRLPTEAEWEKSARGIDGRMYPWGNQQPSNALANFDQIQSGTSPAGSYPQGASYYGILDMAGNVWEWVADGYSEGYYSVSPDKNPLSTSPVNLRVLRGGNWNSDSSGIRATNRFWAFPGRNDMDGFRCAKSD
jgi:formylglycine-generating enzyme required for sulfatase activity